MIKMWLINVVKPINFVHAYQEIPLLFEAFLHSFQYKCTLSRHTIFLTTNAEQVTVSAVLFEALEQQTIFLETMPDGWA